MRDARNTIEKVRTICADLPECEVEGIFGATGIAPGEELTTAALGSGTHRFLCLIHPWMRSTATVS